MLSVIIPAYNEAENIHHARERLCGVLDQNGIPFELLFVNDGSRDDTWARIVACSKEDPRVRGICFSRNFGKEAAIIAGLRSAKGDCCVVIDCDLQHPPEKIPEMVEKWRQGYEVVEGVKRRRGKESRSKRLFARLFYKLLSMSMNMDMEYSSDFKLLDRKAVDAICALPEKAMFFRALSYWIGYKTTQVTYDVAPRLHGETKWSTEKLVGYAIVNLTSFTAKPLLLVIYMGAALLLLALVMGIQTLVRYCMGRSVEGFTTVILLILLIGGGIMICLGIMGYYLARMYDEIKARPQYLIARTTEDEG